MSTDWFRNFSQVSTAHLSLDSLTKVPAPYVELGIHTTCKALQTGAVVGALVSLAHYNWHERLQQQHGRWATTPTLKRTRNTPNITWWRSTALGIRCLRISFLAAPLFHYVYVKQYKRLSKQQMWEQCVRIRLNKKSLYTDRMTLGLGLAGLYWRRARGAMWLISLGVVYTYGMSLLWWSPLDSVLSDRDVRLPLSYYERVVREGEGFTDRCPLVGRPMQGSALVWDIARQYSPQSTSHSS